MYDINKAFDTSQRAIAGVFQKDEIRILYGGDPGNSEPIKGIFEEDIKIWDAELASMVGTGVSGVDVRLSEFTTAPDAEVDKIQVGSMIYRINEVNNDGDGGVLIMLGDDL